MSYEKTSGLSVSNHYGARNTGGTQGVTRTDGTNNEYMVDVDITTDGLDFPFPVTDGSAWVTQVDTAVTNATTFVIGGVDVIAATDAAPVQIPNGNTGIISTDGVTGRVLVTYNKYSL